MAIKKIILSFILMFSFISLSYGEEIVKINYQRKNKDYTDMVVWAWDGGRTPKEWPKGYKYIKKTAFGVYYEVPLVLAAKKVGFLFVNEKTEKKDGGDGEMGSGDRFIDLSKGKEIWVIQGDSNIYYSNPKK